MSFVERSIIFCPYLEGSNIGGSTVFTYPARFTTLLDKGVRISEGLLYAVTVYR